MDFTTQKPIFLQIYDLVLEQILNDGLAEDSRIASVREMAVSVQVNPNTVQRSYQWLQDEEIILQKRGIGFISVEASQMPFRPPIVRLFSLNSHCP